MISILHVVECVAVGRSLFFWFIQDVLIKLYFLQSSMSMQMERLQWDKLQSLLSLHSPRHSLCQKLCSIACSTASEEENIRLPPRGTSEPSRSLQSRENKTDAKDHNTGSPVVRIGREEKGQEAQRKLVRKAGMNGFSKEGWIWNEQLSVCLETRTYHWPETQNLNKIYLF